MFLKTMPNTFCHYLGLLHICSLMNIKYEANTYNGEQHAHTLIMEHAFSTLNAFLDAKGCASFKN